MSDPLSRSAVRLQLSMFVLVVLPMLQWLPLWVGPYCLLMGIVRVMIYLGRWSAPGRLLKSGVITPAIGLLVFQVGLRNSMLLMAGLMTLGLASKLMEIYRRRDALVLIYVAFFLQAVSFLFAQTIALALYILLTLWVSLAALQACFRSERTQPVRRSLRHVLVLMVKGIPVLVIFFIVFPRLGPLWSVNIPTTKAKTGIGDSVAPGTITDLARSGETAFRVVFPSGVRPEKSRLYWRVITYDHYEQGRWTRTRQRPVSAEPVQTLPGGQRINYQVVFEPSGRPQLPVLDLPISISRPGVIGQDRTAWRFPPAESRFRYSATSIDRYRWPNIAKLDRRTQQRYLQLPASGNPRARALALRWWQESQGQPDRFVLHFMDDVHGRFTYTLQPPLLPDNRVDRFMFDSQRGYCEHFASSLTFMLRSVGVPARIVAGYQGGEWNDYEGYLLVRQYAAHAWVEYFTPKHGWVRVDPTTAVAPERIERGADQYLAEEPDFAADSPFGQGGYGDPDGWRYQLQMRLDAIDFVWNSWILNYQDHQYNFTMDLFSKLTLKRVAWGVVVIIFSGVLVWLLWRWMRYRRSQRGRDAVDKELWRLLARLEKRGIQRVPGQPLSHLPPYLSQWPEVQQRFEKIVDLYQRFRYADEQQLEQPLLRQLRACRRSL